MVDQPFQKNDTKTKATNNAISDGRCAALTNAHPVGARNTKYRYHTPISEARCTKTKNKMEKACCFEVGAEAPPDWFVFTSAIAGSVLSFSLVSPAPTSAIYHTYK